MKIEASRGRYNTLLSKAFEWEAAMGLLQNNSPMPAGVVTTYMGGGALIIIIILTGFYVAAFPNYDQSASQCIIMGAHRIQAQ